ncbi:hypothetical protein ACIQUM_36255 [Amycolatopsis azurea]|uniref:hypothetical protein n=1 Tax=Amycolatopsis azurea TaxID=36819 RepID=UPI00382D15BB
MEKTILLPRGSARARESPCEGGRAALEAPRGRTTSATCVTEAPMRDPFRTPATGPRWRALDAPDDARNARFTDPAAAWLNETLSATGTHERDHAGVSTWHGKSSEDTSQTRVTSPSSPVDGCGRVRGTRTVDTMGTIETAAVALQKQEEIKRREEAAARLPLITPLAQAARIAAELAELVAGAQRARKDAPADVCAALDAVVAAAKHAATKVGGSQATAWEAARQGGWSARDLRKLGLRPGSPKPVATAEPAAEPAPPNEDQTRAAIPA